MDGSGECVWLRVGILLIHQMIQLLRMYTPSRSAGTCMRHAEKTLAVFHGQMKMFLVQCDDGKQTVFHVRRVFLNKLIVRVRNASKGSSSSGFLVMSMPSNPGWTLGRISLRIISRSLRLSLFRSTAFLETLREVMMAKRETLSLFLARRIPKLPTKKDLPRLCTASISDRLARRFAA